MIQTAEKLLSEGYASFYPKLKALLQANGKWEARRESVLEICRDHFGYSAYMETLNSEGELALLFEQLKKHPEQIYTYGSALSKIYKEEIMEMYIKTLRSEADRASGRSAYSNVADRIKDFSQAGYNAEAIRLIEELKMVHKRRWSFVELLDSMGKMLEA
ncbi:MAG: hypothetical protein LBT59_07250 [Clostridiales bacterium]|jgi:hypothetical protein|nr:hypothetical protein [Clostridiales bacterium]